MSQNAPQKPQRKEKQKRAGDGENVFMINLEYDLEELLREHTGRPSEESKSSRNLIEAALKTSFGSRVSLESIGLDRFGFSVPDAPLELIIVDSDNANDSLPDLADELYHPRALLDALQRAGVPAELYRPPSWIATESVAGPFSLPDTIIMNRQLRLVLLPPSSVYARRLALLETYIKKFPSIRKLLALLNIILLTGGVLALPPLTSHLLSYVTMAFFTGRYGSKQPSLMDNPLLASSLSFYTHPTVIIHPDGSRNRGSEMSAPIVIAAPPLSDVKPNKKQASLASDFIELLQWWDRMYWDQDVIMPTSALPQLRSFSTNLDSLRTWDWNHSPLIVQDPVNPLNNLAVLITRTDYASIRRVLRNLHRNLRAAVPLSTARELLHPLHTGHSPFVYVPSNNAHGEALSEQMMSFYEKSRPSQAVENRRIQTLNRIASIVKKIYGNHYHPALFGSSRYGVSDPGSDLDIVILDENRPYGFTPEVTEQSLPDIYKLLGLARWLSSSGFTQVVTITGAKVPIIKAKDMSTGLLVDININDQLGLHNTELLAHYCRLWPPLSNLIYVVKKWAKCRGLNNPTGSREAVSFSSYCLTLMTVGYLQAHGVLPNLQDLPAQLDDSSTQNMRDYGYFWIRSGPTTRLKCPIRWYRMPINEWRPRVNPSIGRAFYGWLLYYGYDHKADEFAIRIAQGGIVPRRTKIKAKKLKANSQATTPAAASIASSLSPQTENSLPSNSADDSVSDFEGTPRAVVQAITSDVEDSQLEAAQAEADEMVKEDSVLEDTIRKDPEWQSSLLDEPIRWRNEAFCVSDPFIWEKNCSGSIGRNTINIFILDCQESLREIDEGRSLLHLLNARPRAKSPKTKKAGTTSPRSTQLPPGPQVSNGLVPQLQSLNLQETVQQAQTPQTILYSATPPTALGIQATLATQTQNTLVPTTIPGDFNGTSLVNGSKSTQRGGKSGKPQHGRSASEASRRHTSSNPEPPPHTQNKTRPNKKKPPKVRPSNNRGNPLGASGPSA